MFEYEKQMVGYLFRFYRKKYKMIIQEMISYKSEAVEEYCVDCTKKCKTRNSSISHKTIERIERGQIAKSECFYVDIADKLGFTYEMSNRYTKRINQFEKELLKLIRTKNQKGFKELQVKILNFKTQLEGIIYFQDMLIIFETLINIELFDRFCDDMTLSMMEYMYKYVREDTKKLLLYYFYRYSFRFFSNKRFSNYLVDAIVLYSENVQITFTKRFRDMNKLDYLEYLLNYDCSQFVGADYFFYYQAIALAYINLEKNEAALNYLDKCILVAKESGMIESYAYQTFMRRGILLYQLGRYVDSVESFRMVYFYDINLMMMNIVLFFDAYKKAEMEDAIQHYLTDDKLDEINTDMIRAVFIYYRMKYRFKHPNEVLEDYIVEHLKPHLRKGTWYEKIIREDLIDYTNETRNFKKLHKYMLENKRRKYR